MASPLKMEISPANTPSGLTPGRTPNSGAPPKIRRPKPANPLVQRKPKSRPEHSKQVKTNGTVQDVERLHINGDSAHAGALSSSAGRLSPAPYIDPERAVSGFSSTPKTPYQDLPLVLSKRGDGVRWHSLRFSSRKPVDPGDTTAFTRPVRLHRRDPRDEPQKQEDQKPEDGLDDKERERVNVQKEMRRAQREAEMAQVAPSANTGGQRKIHDSKKKTQQVYGANQTAEQKARSKLRYEETIPWHLEDFDNKNVWVGSYEAALSGTFAAIYPENGAWKLVPLEKHYKFAPRSNRARSAMTIEEAEKSMSRVNRDPKFIKDKQEARIKLEEERQLRQAAKGLYVGRLGDGGGGSGTAKPKVKDETMDADDLDFEEDRFADDEDNPALDFDPDEVTKEADQRIKRDQLQANIFDLKEEKEYEKAEAEEKAQREEEKRLGKGVKKALKRREKNYIYDSDSDANPYTDESSSDDTEAEAAREAEAAKEKKDGASDAEKGLKPHSKKSKPSSGASSRGTNTPSGRPSKHPQPPSRVPTPSLKRPGSPNLSEGSGTETSSRKKAKKLHNGTKHSSSQAHLVPPSSSAPEPQRNSNPSFTTKRAHSTAGSASDNEAGSGAEMSEGGTSRTTIKFGKSSTSNVPSAKGSRAASPAPGAQNLSASTTAKAPPRAAPPSGLSAAVIAGLPSEREIKAKIPAHGISVKDLLDVFELRGKGQKTDYFSKILRKVSVYDKESKLLKPLPE